MMRTQMCDRSVLSDFWYLKHLRLRLAFHFMIYDFMFQAAVYGLGVCAEFGGPVFKPLVGGKFCMIDIRRFILLRINNIYL